MRFRTFVCLAVLSTAGGNLLAVDPAATRGEAAYKQKIEPILQEYCFDCHADGVEKGDFAFDSHKDYASLRADEPLWDVVRQMVNTHVMPPQKKSAPTLQQRDEIVAWIDDSVFWYDPQRPDPGHVVYRRLNRTEYNNTIRDALFLDLKPAAEFPQDDTGYGYDNIADVLSISPILVEKYLRAARAVSAEAIRLRSPEHANIELGAKKFSDVQGETKEWDGVRWFNSDAESVSKFSVPAEGTYRLSVKVSATQAGDEPARLRVKVNDKEIGVFDVTAAYKGEKGKWQEIKQEARLKRGENRVSVAFINDYYDAAFPDANRRDRNMALDEVRIDGPFGLSSPRPSKFLDLLFGGKPAGPPALSISGEDFQKGEGESDFDTGAILLVTNGFVRHPLEIEKPGRYEFTFRVGAQQSGDEKAKFEVKAGGSVIGSFSVTNKGQTPQTFTCSADLPPGRHELQVWFLNDYYDPQTQADRNLWVHEARVKAPGGDQDALSPEHLPDYVAAIGRRLFRRPLMSEEQKRWAGFATGVIADGGSTLEAIGAVLEAMLVSPSFLFRGGATPAGEAVAGTALIDEYSLASRLSYFLWSSPPDEKLMQLAAKGELRKNLPAEVKRMIGDWRGWALTEDFAGQWLQLRDMEIVSPDRRRFPEFRGGTAYEMKRETQMFFDHILRDNRPVIEFLNADYTFVNERLARYYGLKGVKGDKFQKVSLTGTPRGGVLTQGSILTLTSNPTRTSIVKRGKFMLENILGTPPPPAPGDVPPLKEDRRDMEKMTLRQQFEIHRENASCAGCHAFLDPMGFAFENYDAIGRWRDAERGGPVDAEGTLIRGQHFKDYRELRDILVREMSGDFVRNLAENLLTYALGRGLKHYDKPAVQEIVRRTEAGGYRFQEMILAVCESVPFQRMRLEPETSGSE